MAIEPFDRLVDAALERGLDPDEYVRRRTGPRDYSRIRIKISELFPPIPLRRFDYSAVDASTYDLGEPIGYGATKAEAIAELFERIGERDDVEPLQVLLEMCATKETPCPHQPGN